MALLTWPRLLLLCPLSLLISTSCRTAHSNQSTALSLSDGEPEKADGTVIAPAEMKIILQAMAEARDRGMKSVGLNPGVQTDVAKYQQDRILPCLANDVNRWSDLQMHYYCQHGNARMCFTTQAQKSAASAAGNHEQHYRDTYKFCAATASSDSEWNWLTADAQRSAVFRYIMFTNGRTAFLGKPEAFDQQSQDNIINTYYGVADAKNLAECRKRPRRNANQEPDPVDQHCGNSTAAIPPPTGPTPPATPPIANNPPPLAPSVAPPVVVPPVVVPPVVVPPAVVPVSPAPPVYPAPPPSPLPVVIQPSQIQTGVYGLAGSQCEAEIRQVTRDPSRQNDVRSFSLVFGSNCASASGLSSKVDDCVSGLCPWKTASWRTVEMLSLSEQTLTVATNPPATWQFLRSIDTPPTPPGAPFSAVVAGPEPVPEPTPCSKRNSYGMVFCDIPGGTFTMGSSLKEEVSYDDERPAHQVTLSKDFAIMATEVTQAMWSSVCQGTCRGGDNPSKFRDPANPVEQVSWNEITYDFLPKLNGKLSSEGYTYRLPTEAEWEYAARGEKTGPFGVDGDRKDFCWFDGNSNGKTHPVRKLKSNKFGLFDMHGNVWEWVQDAKAEYSSSAVTDPLITAGSLRVLRGGSWFHRERFCRSAVRNDAGPDVRSSNVGFRLVRTR